MYNYNMNHRSINSIMCGYRCNSSKQVVLITARDNDCNRFLTQLGKPEHTMYTHRVALKVVYGNLSQKASNTSVRVQLHLVASRSATARRV